jgi:hypothetical protein
MNIRAISFFVLATLFVCSPRAHAEDAPVAPVPQPVEPLPRADTEAAGDPAAPSGLPAPVPATVPSAPAVSNAALPAGDAATSPASATPEPAVTATASPAVVLPTAPAARSAPVDLVSVTASIASPARRRMGWFGVGVRLGVSELHLAPSESLIGRLNQASGQMFAPGDFSVATSAQTLTPTLHFGGSGYFFKLDLPFSFAPEFTTFGLGLYPINVGILIDRASLFPYVSLGGAVSAVKSRTTADPGTSNKLIGAIVQARAAVGVKYFPIRGLALSAEVGYSPWTAGLMVMPPTAAPGTSGNDQTRMQGGTGSILDFALGAEWL